MKTLSAPLSVCFGITNKCNLNCKHCFASSTFGTQDLTTDEILNIIKQIKELKVFSVSVFGGEPLMRKDFFSILEALSKLKTSLGLNTNGTLITRDIAKRLVHYPIRDYTVSLDGSCPEVQDPFRGKGSFDKNLQGIQNLLEAKRNVLISTTVTRLNYKDLKNIVLLCKRLGVESVRIRDVMYIGNAWCYYEALAMTVREKFEALETVRNLREKFGSFIIGSLTEVLDIMKEIKGKPKEVFPLKIYPCGAATSRCAIRPDGWVVPCEILWDVKAGNLKNESLYDIWHNSPIMKAFREPIEIQEEEIPECKDCEYLSLCYNGHRCSPYYLPEKKFQHKELYCWKENVAGLK